MLWEKLRCKSGLLGLKMGTCQVITELVLVVHPLLKILKKIESLCLQASDNNYQKKLDLWQWETGFSSTTMDLHTKVSLLTSC